MKWIGDLQKLYTVLYENNDPLMKGYIFPDGTIFNDYDHADAWDSIPSNLNHKYAIKYFKYGNEVILQGKLTKAIMDTFVKYGIDPLKIRYGMVDDEMLEVNKKLISDKINNLGWVGIGSGYKAIPKIINGDTFFSHIKSPTGQIYKDRYGAGVSATEMKYFGGVEGVISDKRYYEEISDEDFVKLKDLNK